MRLRRRRLIEERKQKTLKACEVFSVFCMQKVRSHRADSVKAILDIVRKGVVLRITRENFYVREEVSLSSTFRKILLTYCSQSQENQ